MFEVNVKNVIEEQRNVAWVWGSDHKCWWVGGWVGGSCGGGVMLSKISQLIFWVGEGGSAEMHPKKKVI